MGFCIVPDIMNSINTNYMIAQQNYANKRQKILEKIQQEYDISGKDFIDTFQSYYKNIMNERMISEDTGKEVKYETILRHLYRAAEKEAYAILEQHSLNLEEELTAIQELQQQSQMNLKQQQKFLEKEVDKIVKKYADEMTINYSIDKYLPQFISSENKGLAASQIIGYYKKLFRTEISKRLSSEAINKVVKAYPSIVLGYIREDAVSEAGRKVLEHFKMNAANAQTVGGEQTKIDILISLTGNSSKGATSSNDMLGSILKQLDVVNNSFVEVGESQFETEEFLGIQAKPWNIYAPISPWNRPSLGSRAGLLKGYENYLSNNGISNEYSWHTGVLYISQNLETAMGANTVIYATATGMIWSNDLLSQLVARDKYFAFDLDSKHKLTSHVVLSQHLDN